MTEMVERLAKAIAHAESLQSDSGVYPKWSDYRDHARAVLEALREPTEEMVDRFVSRALCVSVHGEGGWSEYARGQWRTMMDAAIGGK